MAKREVTIQMEDVNVLRQLNSEFNEQLIIAAMSREDAEARAGEKSTEE